MYYVDNLIGIPSVRTKLQGVLIVVFLFSQMCGLVRTCVENSFVVECTTAEYGHVVLLGKESQYGTLSSFYRVIDR